MHWTMNPDQLMLVRMTVRRNRWAGKGNNTLHFNVLFNCWHKVRHKLTHSGIRHPPPRALEHEASIGCLTHWLEQGAGCISHELDLSFPLNLWRVQSRQGFQNARPEHPPRAGKAIVWDSTLTKLCYQGPRQLPYLASYSYFYDATLLTVFFFVKLQDAHLQTVLASKTRKPSVLILDVIIITSSSKPHTCRSECLYRASQSTHPNTHWISLLKKHRDD